MDTLEHLKPSTLWHYFGQLCNIPRPSKHEDKIINYLIEFAKQQNLEYKTDRLGNLLITKPATNPAHDLSSIVLQGHVDMVCEKNSNIRHDFYTDPIKPYIDGDWVKARGTTLGADDGVGVAAMMAILADKTLRHGPLECLFTVDEESGLTGAFELPSAFFSGKTLINLDSEDEGELFIGCAGGIDTFATFSYFPLQVPDSPKSFLISITGLKGGHSGDDIHRGRGNAIKIMTDFLCEATLQYAAEINRFEGGNLKNAIPREAFASILIQPQHESNFLDFLDSFRKNTKQLYAATEPSFNIMADIIPAPETKLQNNFQQSLLKALKECPHGVISWSRDMEGLVETSTNLASIKFCKQNEILVTTSQRSMIEAEKQTVAQEVNSIFSKAGAEIKHSKGYPGWTPNVNSTLLNSCSKAYVDLFKTPPKVKAIHAGLECGLFLEKYPNLDMISFGPTIKNAHSPDEQLNIPSVKKFWDLLTGIISRL
jgi:dipeptidase D